jgi:single-strand DNA-binding protein
MDNKITIVGNPTRVPEMSFTAGGVARATFTVAASRRFKKSDGSDGENTVFWNVIVWREAAENLIASNITTRTRLVVTGEVVQRSWQTDDGQKRSTIEISADEVAVSTRWAPVAQDTSGGQRRSSAPAQQQAPAPQEPAGAGYTDDEEPF